MRFEDAYSLEARGRSERFFLCRQVERQVSKDRCVSYQGVTLQYCHAAPGSTAGYHDVAGRSDRNQTMAAGI